MNRTLLMWGGCIATTVALYKLGGVWANILGWGVLTMMYAGLLQVGAAVDARVDDEKRKQSEALAPLEHRGGFEPRASGSPPTVPPPRPSDR